VLWVAADASWQRGMSVALAAVVPAGSYLKAPSEVARCPIGEWKSDTGLPGHCTKCVSGCYH